MTQEEKRQLLSERGELKRIVAETPVEEAIDRGSFQARLAAVEARLAGAADDTREPARARLTFRGRPVVGSHGIFAEFGMNATKAFSDAVSMMAASLGGPLAWTGPIPDRSQNQLLITNTALGSFGFELEEHHVDGFSPTDEGALSAALVQTQQLLQGSAGSDEELADAANGADLRVLAAVRAFLDTLVKNDAVCGVEVGERIFYFRDVGEVRRSWERLSLDNLHEVPVQFEGELQGILPKRRTFEFKIKDSDQVLTGKIGRGIAVPDSLNQHLHKRVRIEVLQTRVGSGKPRYVLNREPQLLSD